MLPPTLSNAALLLPLILSASATPFAASRSAKSPPNCRFAHDYTQASILKNPEPFAQDLLYWEGKFHADNVGYNGNNGMTFDGTLLDQVTGLPTRKNAFSAASKESLQFMLYAHAISGSADAARFLSPDKPSAAPKIAADILEVKLKTYLKFNETYPGFGGLLPWYANAEGSDSIEPTWDWVNRIPALDNGELLWAVYGAIQAMEKSSEKSFQQLAGKWQKWLDFTKTTLPIMFYNGGGRVCASTAIANQSLPVSHPNQTYICENPTYILDDPYEGELVTWWLHFFGGFSSAEKLKLWEVKRAKMKSIDWKEGSKGPVTVLQGYWFSAHEPWKVLEMPYFDVDIVKQVYRNGEVVRTCHSAANKIPGMYASVNNATDPVTGEIQGYISATGVQSVASQNVTESYMITPYSSYPVMLFSKKVGLAWWHNMVGSKKGQNPYGSTEGSRIDGTLVSSFVSWDSKITTVVAMLGGVQDLVRDRMKSEGIYDEFKSVLKREYNMVFKNVKGKNVDFCLPTAQIPDKGLVDYTNCD
ncbi:hypothetical protein V501_00321 [Pseudogymnoascus sp. VKM F-4519 (FW-2642)]|nr:hypothetical protein V501_00321 [Pseudogymnoascus sp. VKM F-4519 (FW-2642)]